MQCVEDEMCDVDGPGSVCHCAEERRGVHHGRTLGTEGCASSHGMLSAMGLSADEDGIGVIGCLNDMRLGVMAMSRDGKDKKCHEQESRDSDSGVPPSAI